MDIPAFIIGISALGTLFGFGCTLVEWQFENRLFGTVPQSPPRPHAKAAGSRGESGRKAIGAASTGAVHG